MEIVMSGIAKAFGYKNQVLRDVSITSQGRARFTP